MERTFFKELGGNLRLCIKGQFGWQNIVLGVLCLKKLDNPFYILCVI